MSEQQAVRTLVKSAPELWEVCSDAASLGRHLEAFGEIRITRLDPETTVAWEGERASGTVRIEPSGWGTRVTLTAAPAQVVPAVPVVPVVDAVLVEAAVPVEAAIPVAETDPVPEPVVAVLPVASPPAPSGGLFGWLRRRRRPAAQTAPVVTGREAPVAAAPVAAAVAEPADTAAALDAALESLGRAHHRPFSRT